MSRTAAAISFLAPLAFAPHLLFYYDVTPKVAVLFLGAAALLVLAAFHLDSLLAFCGTGEGRWFTIAILVSAGATVLSTVLAAHPALAWNGSNWRRFGGLTQLACLAIPLIVAAGTPGAEERIRPIFRAICLAGILVSLYGIAQYFDLDPFLDPAAYSAGDGPYRIVRPPATLGHSDYFAAFLLWPLFLGISLARTDAKWRWIGVAATILDTVAILLSGSRGAMLGLACGGVLYAWRAKPNLRIAGTTVGLTAIALAAFYFSPAGERLRARVYWIGDEPAGGARFLLWRDSLRMAAARPIAGFGPDNFVAEFPKFQSVELARQFPDFYHESPHNVWLDTLTSEGILGLSAQLALIGLAIAAGIRGLKKKPDLATGLLAGLVSVLAAHQFSVLTAVNALFLYLGCGLLAGLSAERGSPNPAVQYRAVFLAAGGAAAAGLLFGSFRMVAADRALALTERSIASGETSSAAASFRRAVDLRDSGLTADLYFSRRWARAAADSHNVITKLYLGQLAAGAATLASEVPEGQANAWFNVAELSASRDDTGSVESALRSAIARSPNWFKPHWALARLLFLEGRKEEAYAESVKAMDLNRKDREVASTLASILSFRNDPGKGPNP